MSRLAQTFKSARSRGKGAFIAFVTAGFPKKKMLRDIVLTLEDAGVDIVELGMPFSDPLADGPIIQASSQEALKQGVTLRWVLDEVAQLRKKTSLPLVLMSYANPLFHRGIEHFVTDATTAGLDGVIVPDCPVEEAGELIRSARGASLDTIFFVSPTTPEKRIARIDRATRGFIYYVSLTGVTGPRAKLPRSLISHIRSIKKLVSTPVCVGFGIGSREQVRSLTRVADGVIVGSALVQYIRDNGHKKTFLSDLKKFVQGLQ